MISQGYELDRQRRKVSAWLTLWEYGQAREALRRMGEQFPEPPARSREAFADAIYNLTGEGQAEPGLAGLFQAQLPPALHLLDGGQEHTPRGVSAVGRKPASACDMGISPAGRSYEPPGGRPATHTSEETT